MGIIATNLPPGTQWQEIKDHFAQCGQPVAFCSTAAGSDGPVIGEVRYTDGAHAQLAINTLNGTQIGGSSIFVMAAPNSQDGTKLMVQGLPNGCQWQELKDHFAQIGSVAFAQVAPIP